jgi:hypothetical protein
MSICEYFILPRLSLCVHFNLYSAHTPVWFLSLSVCLSVYLSICLSVYLSICLSFYLYTPKYNDYCPVSLSQPHREIIT